MHLRMIGVLFVSISCLSASWSLRVVPHNGVVSNPKGEEVNCRGPLWEEQEGRAKHPQYLHKYT